MTLDAIKAHLRIDGARVDLPHALAAFEREAMEAALVATGANKAAAARQLQMPLATFRRRVKHYAIDPSGAR